MSSPASSFRPGLWPSLIVPPAILLLLLLGTWQLERLAWKRDLIAALEAPAVPLPATRAEAEPLELRRVSARGTYLHASEFHRYVAQPPKGTGVEVITPLRLDDGRLLFVNRGFVPEALRQASSRPDGQTPGVVEIEGRLRIGRGRPFFFLPDNNPGANLWLFVDPVQMAATAGLERVIDFYVDAAVETPAPAPGVRAPRPTGDRVELRNDHLQYAITWYSLALAAVVIFVLFGRRRALSR